VEGGLSGEKSRGGVGVVVGGTGGGVGRSGGGVVVVDVADVAHARPDTTTNRRSGAFAIVRARRGDEAAARRIVVLCCRMRRRTKVVGAKSGLSLRTRRAIEEELGGIHQMDHKFV
jgi:hypothetical protein